MNALCPCPSALPNKVGIRWATSTGFNRKQKSSREVRQGLKGRCRAAGQVGTSWASP